jgi:hypothetical protein
MQQSGRYTARPYRGRLEQTRRGSQGDLSNDLASFQVCDGACIDTLDYSGNLTAAFDNW